MQNVDYVEIGKRIREARKAQGLTQEEASERCDITAAYYGNIERGDKKMSVETLVKISNGLKISTDHLLYGGMDTLAKQDKLTVYLAGLRGKVGETQMERFLTIMDAVADVIDKI